MDNEDKVEGKELQVSDSKEIFLKDDAVHDIGGETYNLEKEFQQTKKNKSLFIWITIMLFVAVFTAAAVLVTNFIQNQSKNVPVDIADFESVNLKDVLNKAKQLESELGKAQRELKDLRNEMNEKIADVQKKAEQDIELIENTNLAQAEENRQIAEVRAAEATEIENVRAEYEPLIAEKEAEIAGIQEKLEEYDTQMVERAKQQEEILNNQQRKFELELEETVTYYEDKVEELETQREEEVSSLKNYQEEFVKQLKLNQENEIARLKQEQADEIQRLILKYNPIFSSDELTAILAIAVGNIPSLRLDTYKTVLQNEGIISRSEFDIIHSNIYTQNTLLDRLKEVPYINSIPDTLNRIYFYANAVYNSYEALVGNMVGTIEYKNNVIMDRNTQLSYYQYALENLIKESREHGYILDPRNPNNIQIFLDETVNVSNGDTAYVFRTDDELIAEIRFILRNGTVTAALAEQVSDETTIQPYDKILIQIE